ncbi:MAG: hypothetical protein KAH84_06965 [Thiomargarita sp.]|nr:hypothetical protein [Thiomargarita sp.]
MYAVEFETDISGNTVQIPTHLLSRIAKHRHVKIILLLPEEVNTAHKIDLKSEILKIGKNCSSLPLLDDRTPNDILSYDNNGLPT